ncbi:uncharacterized protein LY89DRAFT_676086 [Mollisia scopiformis]|uniref:Uncharacterized protein n=1 Tax=Mollisia scopiformis TaxID=149040 RepID=A0A132BBQ3_MOLSC|nr:uncharacterized protein LY89DRAFT_676086 [Mollisia scopiformis]KUJ09274.1 hypothetical protein LY89DRAFT_676086 [Mollisia scopiformis]
MLARQSRNLSEKQLSLEHFMRSISLTERSSRKREQILRRLSNCNEALGGLSRAAAPFEYSSSEVSNTPSSKIQRSYSQRRRTIADSVHNLLTTHWLDGESMAERDARLLLKSYNKPIAGLEEHFDVWFMVSSDPEAETRWQESGIWVIHKDEYVPLRASVQSSTVTEMELTTLSAGTSNGALAHSINTKSIRFDIIHRNGLVDSLSRTGLWEIKEQGLGNLIWEGAKHAPRHLDIIVQEEKLYWTSDLPRNNSGLQHFISLQQILKDGLLKQEMEKRLLKRCTLAYSLASSFLQLCDGRWSPCAWTCDMISFFYSGDSTLDISRPYLSTRFEESGSPSIVPQESSEFRYRLHPYPHILALGLMLLQIYLASPIENFRIPGHPNNDKNAVYNIDRDLGTALVMLEKCEGNSMKEYNNAIKACLAPQLPIDSSLNEEEFRQKVYTDIVSPLALTLRDGYGNNVENDDWVSRVFSDDPHLQVPAVGNTKLSSVTEKHVNGSSPQPESSSSNNGNNNKINADQWLLELAKSIHPLLNRTSLEKMSPPFNKIINRRGNIKIAILDTGIDLPISALETNEDRLMGWKDWVNGGAEETAYIDQDGHGTHCAGLILKVAPTMDLYVARVFEKEDDRETITPSDLLNRRIAKAIRHAVDEWQVDIISMSFGFENDIDIIESAVDHANTKNTIILAAAGNRGGLSHPAWPARSKKAIGIHASDGFGNKGPFTANPTDGSANFSLPGVDVLSFWPKHLGPDIRVRRSGTSCATAIAAGLAGAVLDLVGLHLSRKESIEHEFETRWPKLQSSDGMRVAFRLMAGGRDGILRAMSYKGLDIQNFAFFAAENIPSFHHDDWLLSRPHLLDRAAHKKTYFLSPNWDILPDTSVRLGSIIAHSTKPTRPLNGGSQLPPSPAPTTATVQDWHLERSKLIEAKVGVWLSFLQFSGIGGDVGYNRDRKDEEVYKCKRLETEHFQPNKKYIFDSLGDSEVKAYIEEGLWKKPVYMITGVKIARGFSVTTEKKKSNGGEGKAGVDTTSIGIPVQVGPEVKVVYTKKEKMTFKKSTDCVFAYRLIKIQSKKGDKFSEDDYNKGTLLHGGEQNDKEENVEQFDENWDVGELLEALNDVKGGLEERVVSEDD